MREYANNVSLGLLKTECRHPNKLIDPLKRIDPQISELSIYRLVENMNRELEAIENVNAYSGIIDENGSIDIEISEENGDILQAFTIRASRR